LRLLNIRDKGELQALYEAASGLRERYFGRQVYLYGFLYMSTFCRNSCSFCSYRAGNAHCSRYRKSTEEVVQAARRLEQSGVHLLDLTMGEDPYFHSRPDGFASLLEMVQAVRSETSLPLMLSPGVVPSDVLQEMKTAGVSWYACYQETYSRRLFTALRRGQSFESRLAAKREAQRLGLLTEEGILCGVGESPAELAGSLSAMSGMGFDQLRAMTFVPQAGTPMEAHRSAGPDTELKLIALLRLLNPAKLIPASLDVSGLQGLQERLRAGANVVTSIVPPGCGLSGVANHSLDIENFNRTVERIESQLQSLGLETGSVNGYRNWIRQASLASTSDAPA
jgi:methylornithine synthase